MKLQVCLNELLNVIKINKIIKDQLKKQKIYTISQANSFWPEAIL